MRNKSDRRERGRVTYRINRVVIAYRFMSIRRFSFTIGPVDDIRDKFLIRHLRSTRIRHCIREKCNSARIILTRKSR